MGVIVVNIKVVKTRLKFEAVLFVFFLQFYPMSDLVFAGGEVNWLPPPIPIQLPVSILNGKLLEFKDKLWCINGNINSDPAEIFVSENGIDWLAQKTQSSFSGRPRCAAIVFKDKIWVIGGLTSVKGKKGYAKETNEIWSSSDGVHWDLSPNSPWPKGVENQSCLVFKNRLFVIGGAQNNSWPGKEWVSKDGVVWIGRDPKGLTLGEEQVCFVFGDKVWYLGGDNHQGEWSSRDGENWTKIKKGLPFTVGTATQAWVMPEGVYLGGTGIRESDSITSSSDSVWFSPDGKRWKMFLGNAPFSTGFGFVGAVFHKTMWAVASRGEVFFSSEDSLDVSAKSALEKHRPRK